MSFSLDSDTPSTAQPDNHTHEAPPPYEPLSPLIVRADDMTAEDAERHEQSISPNDTQTIVGFDDMTAEAADNHVQPSDHDRFDLTGEDAPLESESDTEDHSILAAIGATSHSLTSDQVGASPQSHCTTPQAKPLSNTAPDTQSSSSTAAPSAHKRNDQVSTRTQEQKYPAPSAHTQDIRPSTQPQERKHPAALCHSDGPPPGCNTLIELLAAHPNPYDSQTTEPLVNRDAFPMTPSSLEEEDSSVARQNNQATLIQNVGWRTDCNILLTTLHVNFLNHQAFIYDATHTRRKLMDLAHFFVREHPHSRLIHEYPEAAPRRIYNYMCDHLMKNIRRWMGKMWDTCAKDCMSGHDVDDTLRDNFYGRGMWEGPGTEPSRFTAVENEWSHDMFAHFSHRWIPTTIEEFANFRGYHPNNVDIKLPAWPVWLTDRINSYWVSTLAQQSTSPPNSLPSDNRRPHPPNTSSTSSPPCTIATRMAPQRPVPSSQIATPTSTRPHAKAAIPSQTSSQSATHPAPVTATFDTHRFTDAMCTAITTAMSQAMGPFMANLPRSQAPTRPSRVATPDAKRKKRTRSPSPPPTPPRTGDGFRNTPPSPATEYHRTSRPDPIGKKPATPDAKQSRITGRSTTSTERRSITSSERRSATSTARSSSTSLERRTGTTTARKPHTHTERIPSPAQRRRPHRPQVTVTLRRDRPSNHRKEEHHDTIPAERPADLYAGPRGGIMQFCCWGKDCAINGCKYVHSYPHWLKGVDCPHTNYQHFQDTCPFANCPSPLTSKFG